jgi:hypothetical protein
VRLSPVLMMKLFFLWISGPCFKILSLNTYCKSTWSPINSARLCYPRSLCVCKFICDIVLLGKHPVLKIPSM